jgi:hypothetical protein
MRKADSARPIQRTPATALMRSAALANVSLHQMFVNVGILPLHAGTLQQGEGFRSCSRAPTAAYQAQRQVLALTAGQAFLASAAHC